MTGSRDAQFHELANYYDAINDWKDYRAESRRLETLARRQGIARNPTWLDVACGTGRHLEFLRQTHDCVGVDASPEMLRLARRRLRGVPLVRGDMRTFQLGRRFDVVSCLFSAIGHLQTVADVQQTFANFSHHLNPGGVAIVEPWLEPSAFQPGMIQLRTHESRALTVSRMAFSTRRGHRSMIRWHFLIGEPGRRIRYRESTSVGVLLSRDHLVRLMGRAGLQPMFLARGLTPGRGLLLGKVAGTG